MLPDPKPRLLGVVSQQADDWLTECSDREWQSIAWVMDCIEAGDFDTLPIGPSYLIEEAFTVLTTDGTYLVVDFPPEADDEYDVLLAGVITPPPGYGLEA